MDKNNKDSNGNKSTSNDSQDISSKVIPLKLKQQKAARLEQKKIEEEKKKKQEEDDILQKDNQNKLDNKNKKTAKSPKKKHKWTAKFNEGLASFHQSHFTTKEEIGFVFSWLVCYIFFASFVSIQLTKLKIDNGWNMFITECIITVVPFLLDVLIVRMKNKSKLKVISFVKRWTGYFFNSIKEHWKLILLATFIGIVLEIFTSVGCTMIFGRVSSAQSNNTIINNSIIAQPLFILAVTIFAPFCEELTFRWGLTSSINSIFRMNKNVVASEKLSKYAYLTAVILSATLFGLLHSKTLATTSILSQVIPLMLFALWLQYLQKKSNSVIPSIMVHVLYNTITLLVTL